MGKIVVSQNVTLDGVVEDPSGEGGFRHGGWFVQFMGQDWEAWAELELAEAHAAGTHAGVAKGPGEPAAGDPDQRPAGGQTGGA